MFAILLVTALALIFTGSTAALVWANVEKGWHDTVGVPSCIIMLISGVLLAFTSIFWTALYVKSYGEIVGMEAFYNDTLSAYEHTITATGAVEIVEAEAGLIDIAYQGQGTAASERIKELRDKIESYNASYWHYQRFNKLFVADYFLADLPDYLHPIHLGESQ